MIYIAQEIPIVITLHYNDLYTIIIIIISTFIPILTIIYYTVVLFIISARVTITLPGGPHSSEVLRAWRR